MTTEFFRNVDREEILCEAKTLFTKVRDIPYVLGLDGNPNKLLSEYKGNCTRKHLYLATKLIPLGYKISLGIATFDWKELPIPANITSLLKDPTDTHLFLYASLNGKESIVDATWDLQMPEGFIKDNWDGESSMPISVPIKSIWREDINIFQTKALVDKSLRILRNIFESKKPTPFNDAFNEWLGRTE
ncbi:MAG: hypothetical protein ABIJ05_01460 [Patescibacteria group bacterium]